MDTRCLCALLKCDSWTANDEQSLRLSICNCVHTVLSIENANLLCKLDHIKANKNEIEQRKSGTKTRNSYLTLTYEIAVCNYQLQLPFAINVCDYYMKLTFATIIYNQCLQLPYEINICDYRLQSMFAITIWHLQLPFAIDIRINNCNWHFKSVNNS